MGFEQRTSIYFICEECGHEFEIPGHAKYNTIYNCSKEGCNYRETFLGLTTPTKYDISASWSDERLGFFRRVFRNNIVQGIFAALIVFIILGGVTWIITSNFFNDLQEELQEIRNEISLIERER